MESKSISYKMAFAFVLALSQISCYSQTIISYQYTRTNELDSGFFFNIIKPFYPSVEDKDFNYSLTVRSEKLDDDIFAANCKYNLTDTSVANIADGFGHPIFVIPTDSILVKIKKLEKTNGQFIINEKYIVPWFHTLKFIGKNKFIYSLFDSLSYNTGSPFVTAVNLKIADYDLNKYFSLLTNLYQKRINYVTGYCSLYKIPKTIEALALAEIKSSYISNLIQPLSNSVMQSLWTYYPKAYLDTLANFKFNDYYLFTHTTLYPKLLYKYFLLYKSVASDKTHEQPANMQNIYAAINTCVNNKKIREYLSAKFFKNNSENNDHTIKTLFTTYKQNFPQSQYNGYIDSILKIQLRSVSFTYDEALSTSISDSAGNIVSIKTLLQGRPVLIDCWASWCIPCIAQMPSSHKLEEKFKNKIDFVYLSFDKEKAPWMSQSNVLNINKKSFLIKDDFKSQFASYFKMSSIPRYILISKDGSLISGKAPRPSQRELEILLDRASL